MKSTGRTLRLWPKRLDLQITLIVILLVIGATVVFSIHAASEHARWGKEDSVHQAQVLAANVAATTSDRILMSDLASIEVALLQAAQFQAVRRIVVVDPSGWILAQVRREAGGQAAPRYDVAALPVPIGKEAVTTEENDRLVLWAPVQAGTLMGWVRIDYALDPIDARVADIWRDNALDGLIVIALAVPLLLWLLRGPLGALRMATTFARRLGEPDLGPLALRGSAQEVERLGDALNELLVRFYEREHCLRQSERNLAQAQRLAQMGSWQLDPASGEMRWSDEVFRILGLAKGTEPSIDAMVTPFGDEERRKLRSALAQVETQGVPWESNLTLAPSLGDARILHVQIRKLDSETGVLFAGTFQDITEREGVLAELRRSEVRFRQLVEQASDAILLIGPDGHLTDVNQRATECLGYSREHLIGYPVEELAARHEGQWFTEIASKLREADRVVRELTFISRAGHPLAMELVVARFDGDVAGSVLAFARDISERRATEAKIRQLAAAMEQTADLVMITDRQGVIEYVNPAFEQATGYGSEEILGQTPAIIKSAQQTPEFSNALWQTILSGRRFQQVFVNRRKDGTLFYENKTITPLKSERGEITHFLSTGKDITLQVQTESRLKYLMHHDADTGLPNRHHFEERLSQALRHAKAEGELVAVLAVHVRLLETIKKAIGPEPYQEVLRTTSGRLASLLGEEDALASLGGEDLVILVAGRDSVDAVATLCQQVSDTIAERIVVQGHEFYLSACTGVSLYPNDGTDAGELVQNAEAALLRARRTGENAILFYTPDLNQRVRDRLAMEARLRRALEESEFHLFYQPQIEMQTGRITGVEALLRWRHPERGLVAPAEFIPIMEETGLIIPVGEWVLETAARQFKAWQDEGCAPDVVAVNLSVRQFGQAALVDLTRRTLEEVGLAADCLEYEITESALISAPDDVARLLRELRELGVRLSIDDFGTGYSSLSYLKQFPIQALKIPKVFIDDIASSPNGATLAHTIIGLAHSMQLKVVAEGVEDAHQLRWLERNECDLVQGYYFSKPVSAADATRMLRRTRGVIRHEVAGHARG